MTASGSHPPVVILGLGPSGLEICRALGRRGVRAIVLDVAPGIAAHSRYAEPYLCPDPRRQPDQLLAELSALAAGLDARPALMPMGDDWSVFMANGGERLRECCRFVQPAPEIMISLTDKVASHQLALEHGIDVPRSVLLREETDLATHGAEITYPCVLKPANAADWAQPEARAALGRAKIVRAHDAESLREAFLRSRPFAGRHIVQELLPGDDAENYYVVCHIGRDGQQHASFVHRKLLMRPPGRGIGCLIESVRFPELAERAKSFLRAVGHIGLAGMEFKRDPRDGRMKLLDINPRWGQGDSLAGICGLDVAWLHYCDCVGLAAEAPQDYRVGVKWIQARSVVAASWMAARERRGSLLRTLARLRGEVHHSVLAWDDLGPAAWSVKEMVASRIRPRRSRPAGDIPALRRFL